MGTKLYSVDVHFDFQMEIYEYGISIYADDYYLCAYSVLVFRIGIPYCGIPRNIYIIRYISMRFRFVYSYCGLRVVFWIYSILLELM